MDKPHILLICSRLDLPGGVERSVVNIANLLYKNSHPTTILILDDVAKIFYPIEVGIQVLQKNLHFGITKKGNMLTRKLAWLKHVQQLHNLLKHLAPDLIISTDYSFTITSWLAARGLPIRLISREAHHFYWLKRNRFWERLFRWIYPKVDAVVSLNSTEEKYYTGMNCRTAIIPNYVKQNSAVDSSKKKKILLSVGWIIERKGFDLIPAIAEPIFKDFTDWQWIIIGTGEKENGLLQQVKQRYLQNNISIIHPADHMLDEFYREASIYVLTSRSEGFPNVLLEAMSFATPCVAFDCLSGPADIIQQNKNGMLVELENWDKMSRVIRQLIENEQNRICMGINAQESMKQYSPDTIYSLWNKLFERLLQQD